MADKDFVVKNGLVVSNSTLRIANTVGISANGSLGFPGQVLTTNGSAVFWASGTGNVNTSAQFTWNNSQFYSANLVLNSTADLVFNTGASIWAQGSKGANGQVLSTNGESVYWANVSNPDVLLKSQNLADLPDKSKSRTNLGLGVAATQGVGFAAGQVAPGDQTPSRSGTGASGTWGISITGSAASAAVATTAQGLDSTKGYTVNGLRSNFVMLGTSPNSGSTGAVILADAPGDPDSVFLQGTNNAASIQYGFLKIPKTGEIRTQVGPLAIIPTYSSAATNFPINTWIQAPYDCFVSGIMGGPYTNGFYALSGITPQAYTIVGFYGDDINNNTKWATITFFVRRGCWFQIQSEVDYNPHYYNLY